LKAKPNPAKNLSRPSRLSTKLSSALAGPVFSFLLAVVMATIVWGVGKPVNEYDQTTTIGYLKPGGPADLAGLKSGEPREIEVDGKPVDCFTGPLHSITWRIVRCQKAEPSLFKIERDGQILTINSGWERDENPKWKRKSFRKVQIGPKRVPAVGKILAGSPAEKGGLQRRRSELRQ